MVVCGRIDNFFYKTIYNYFKRKEDVEVKMSDGIVCLTYAAEKIIKEWPQYKKEVVLGSNSMQYRYGAF